MVSIPATPVRHDRWDRAGLWLVSDGVIVEKGTDDPVFTSPPGAVLLVVGAWRPWFDRAVRDGGVPKGFHPRERRHTAASLAVSAGGNVKAVQRMLGHAKASMTLDSCAGPFDGDLEALVDHLDALARRSNRRCCWSGTWVWWSMEHTAGRPCANRRAEAGVGPWAGN
nr:tyrosine-type recombinase/integrase [Phytoactinopolyspora mesophila]